jgi:bifunctional non-homologous end joining protein LigD
MRKDVRAGKVFIDWSQNDDHKTTVCVYSLRAQPTPSVSAPLAWEEVEAAVKARDASALRFGPEDVLHRVEEHGDLFAPVLKKKQKLPAVRK